MPILYSQALLGAMTLKNHLVMAPMTRSRALDNIPNALMAEYYAQRATAGLIVAEATSPSPNGLGYPRIPGIFSRDQVEGWKAVTESVHAKGAKIFVQLMHCGRVAHPLNLPAGARVLAPSAVAADGEMYTDAEGMKHHPVPQAMTKADIDAAIAEYAQAAKNAVTAGFDGIELHGANGYLLEQFIRPNSNRRLRCRACRTGLGRGQMRSRRRGATLPCQSRPRGSMADRRGGERARYGYLLYTRTQGLYRLPRVE
jgi:N-ethylmaleimide reductase